MKRSGQNSHAGTDPRRTMLRKAARRAGLRYSVDEGPGYRRRRSGRGFHYLSLRGERIRSETTVNRIRRLVIPPAWQDVWINPDPHGHLQASGRDDRGRKQFIYHSDWRATRDEAKFGQLAAFAEALPGLRRAVAKSLRRPALDREHVSALAVRLLEISLIRVGNTSYARTNGSYGLTTLRNRHASISRNTIVFSFNGKGGVRQKVEMQNVRLARMMRRLQELPGQELFQYVDDDGRQHLLRSDDVNHYLREKCGGDFTAKHFRTWAGTVIATLELAPAPPPQTKSELKRTITAAVRVVARRLGNTAAIARKSYIHPLVFELFAQQKLPAIPRPKTWPRSRPRLGLAPEERAVLRLLRKNLPKK